MKFPKLMHIFVFALFAVLMSCQDAASNKKSTTNDNSNQNGQGDDEDRPPTNNGGNSSTTPTVEHLSKFHVIASETIRLNSGIRYIGKAADADTNTVKGIAVADDEASTGIDADVEVWLSTSASKYGKYFLDSGKMAEKSDGKKYEHKWFAVKKNAVTTALSLEGDSAKVLLANASVNVPTRRKVTFKGDIFDEAAGFPLLILRVYDPDTSDKEIDDDFVDEWKIQFSKATAPNLEDISLTDIKGTRKGSAITAAELRIPDASPPAKNDFTGQSSPEFTIALPADPGAAADGNNVAFSFKIAGDDVADFTWTITGTTSEAARANGTVVETFVRNDLEGAATSDDRADVTADPTNGRNVRIDFLASPSKNGAATLVGTDKYGQKVTINLKFDHLLREAS